MFKLLLVAISLWGLNIHTSFAEPLSNPQTDSVNPQAPIKTQFKGITPELLEKAVQRLTEVL